MILVLVGDTSAQVGSTSNVEMACQHLYKIMDKYNKSFDVYTDQNVGGNHYIPSGWMGDWGDITFDGDHAVNPHSGLTCIRIDYSAQESQGEGWAGIYWQDPEDNWGNLEGGFDLTRATKLTFWARGKNGGEWIDFKVGGINRQPYHNSNFLYQDAFGPISTGFVQLTDTWQEYNIPLDEDYFDLYRDQHLSYYPSGWMGDWSDITFDDQHTGSPYSGRTCIRINYAAQGSQGMNWAGIYWQNPPNNWGNLEGGFDLTGFEKLIFRARGHYGGEKAEFKVGGITGPYGDSLKPAESTGVITLTNTWQEYSIDLVGEDLSHIVGGFCWVTNTTQNPQGCTIYLDDIRYQRPINAEALRQVIGGFVWVTNKDSNPNGCTLYLDDIQFNKARPDTLRFLVSYEIIDPIGEAPLANAAFTYDNALAMLAFIAQGSEDDWRRAEIIGRSFLYAQNHDRSYSDGRLRNAYRSGDIVENVTGNALLPGWWDDVENMWFEDKEQVSSYTGNLAWVIIAWLRYYETNKDMDFLNAALQLGRWIYKKTYDTLGPGGYTGGYQGWASDPPEKIKWKSTEHNIDVYVAFKKLHELTGDDTWLDRALHAERFIQAMWNPDKGHFWTGTLDDGETINEDVRPADVNTWALMALGNYEEGIQWVENNCRVDPCPSCGGWKGFDFNDDQDGVWFEGTAHTVVAFQILNETLKYCEFINEIRRAQIEATNNNGKGIVAACHDGVTTGFDWVYNNRLHIGATGWYIFAENRYNPFWGTTTIPEPVPGTPSNPNPLNGVTGVSINADLDWSDCSNTDSYDVYWGISPSPPLYTRVATSACSLPAMSYNTLYYWKIVAKNSCGNSTLGPVWSFTTENEFGPCRLIAPNGGEAIASGSSYTIEWLAPPEAVSFKLKYSINNGKDWKPIDRGIVDTSYEWTVPPPTRNKTRCLAKVIGYDASDKKVGTDKSDEPFTIEVVRITYPDGEESLTSGHPLTITWETNETKRPVTKVILKCTTNGGKRWRKIHKLTEDTGSYETTVPEVPKTKSKCKMKVVLKAANRKTVGTDTSDSYFTIEPGS